MTTRRDAPRAQVDVDALRVVGARLGLPPGRLETLVLAICTRPLGDVGPVAVHAPGEVSVLAASHAERGTLLTEAVASLSRTSGKSEAAVVLAGAAPPGVGARWLLDLASGTLFGTEVAAATVARVAARIDCLASHIATEGASDASLGELVAVPPRERAELLAWGRGPVQNVEAGSVRTAADDVRRWAEVTPRSIALVVGDVSLAYADLNARVSTVAAGLAQRGVRRGARVAVALDRGIDLVVTMLAAWRLGAAYVPIDLGYPTERIRYILADAACEIVVHTTTDRLPEVSGAAWNLRTTPPSGGGIEPTDAARGEDLAYIIYTSGSTGRPKGVEVAHAALRNTIGSKVALLQMTEADCQVAVMSQAFDASIFELTMPLLAGGRLVVATRAELEDYPVLAHTLDRARPSVMGATPPTWRGLLETGWRPAAGLRAMVGGEALPADLARKLAPLCRVFNMYGLTETAISSTVFEVDGRAMGATAPIGRPLPNMMARVLAENGELAQVGEPGELYIGGIGLASGYRGSPDMTRSRFVSDPIGENEARFFRTGDRAVWRHDGELEFLGRLDSQVKIRGMRVELGEIETSLAECDHVAAVVADVRDIDGEVGVVAYVQSKEGQASWAQLREEALRRLPPHMVPSAFVAIEQVPLTPNGKVDRSRLPTPDQVAATGPAGKERNDEIDPIAARVRAALDAVLGENVSDLSSLDSLGRARLRQALGRAGVKVSLRELFEATSPASLVATLHARNLTVAEEEAPGVGAADEAYPLTMNQKFPTLTHLSNPGTGAWNCQIAFTVTSVDLSALEAAWRLVVERHGALRLRFRWRGLAYPEQSISSTKAPWEVVDMTSSGARYAEHLRAFQESQLRTTFDVEVPPLHRLVVVRGPGGEVDVLWTYFSAIIDGWSSAIVVRDLFAYYERVVTGDTTPLDPAPRYFDHLRRMASRDWTQAEPFFEAAMSGYRMPPPLCRQLGGDEAERDPSTMPADLRALFEALRDKPFRTEGVGAKMTQLFEGDVERLLGASSRFGVAPSTLLQSAWAVTLMREYRCKDILLGMVAANRPDYEAAVGKYTSMLPFRYQMVDDAVLGDWLRRNEQFVIDVLAYEGLPGQHWVKFLKAEPWEFPFQSTFTFVNYVGAGRGEQTLSSGLTVSHSRQLDAGIPPAFGMVVIPGTSYLCRLEYNRDGGYDEALLSRMLDTFVELVKAMSVASDDARASAWLESPLGARSLGVPLGFL